MKKTKIVNNKLELIREADANISNLRKKKVVGCSSS